jgi:hypothetical protein
MMVWSHCSKRHDQVLSLVRRHSLRKGPWGLLIALCLRFDVSEDIINQPCPLTGTAVFLVNEFR